MISSVNHVNNHVTSTLWHQRLGHPAIHPLNHLSRSVLGISSKLKSFCEVCHLAKQTRLPFGHGSIKTKAPFDLIHCDIWGAFRVPSISRAHYFLTIVDDFSRHTWVYLMRHKSETQGLLRNFFAQVQTQFNTTVKCLRADNGREFTSMLFFLTAKAFNLNIVVLLPLNKMALWNTNIDTFSMSLGLYVFKLTCLCIFGVKVC